MISKLVLNKCYLKGDSDVIFIEFKSSNPNINFYRLHECNLH